MSRTFPSAGVVVVLLALIATPVRAGNAVDFNRDVRPILSDKCYFCHGPDPKQRKAGLRLDDRAVAIKKGAIVPGQAAESDLIDRINATDDSKMPPADSHKTLTEAQKDTLMRWIAGGAVYASHWAYTPLRRPAVPKTASFPGSAWERNAREVPPRFGFSNEAEPRKPLHSQAEPGNEFSCGLRHPE